VIAGLQEVARQFGVSTSLVALASAGVLTGLVLMAQSIGQWFDDLDS
jgi:hypothetical protein